MERTLRRNGNYEMVMIMTSLLTSLFWITLIYSTKICNSSPFSVPTMSIKIPQMIQTTYVDEPDLLQNEIEQTIISSNTLLTGEAISNNIIYTDDEVLSYNVFTLSEMEENVDSIEEFRFFSGNTKKDGFNLDKISFENLSLQEVEFTPIISKLETIQEEDFDIEELSTIKTPVVEDNTTVNYIGIDELQLSEDMKLNVRTGLSKEDFAELIGNMKYDYSGFFAENSECIYDLCEEYELNELFFCGLIAAESGWEITTNHRNTNNYISMSANGELIKFDTVHEGLEAGVKLLHNEYLTEGGKYYNGEKLADVKMCYNPNSETWEDLVYSCMTYIVK